MGQGGETTCPQSLKVSAVVHGNVGQALRPSVLGTGPPCRDDSGLSSRPPGDWDPNPFWQVTPSCPCPLSLPLSNDGYFKGYFDSLRCNKKLAISYYEAVLQSCGSPFYPLRFKCLYLLSLVFRNIKLYSICRKPSYLALQFIAPSVDISFA